MPRPRSTERLLALVQKREASPRLRLGRHLYGMESPALQLLVAVVFIIATVMIMIMMMMMMIVVLMIVGTWISAKARVRRTAWIANGSPIRQYTRAGCTSSGRNTTCASLKRFEDLLQRFHIPFHEIEVGGKRVLALIWVPGKRCYSSGAIA
jgi:hypothetical protein